MFFLSIKFNVSSYKGKGNGGSMIKYRNEPFIPVDRKFSRACLADGRPVFLSTASSSSRASRICTIANVWAHLKRRTRGANRDSRRVVHAHLRSGAAWLRPLPIRSRRTVHCNHCASGYAGESTSPEEGKDKVANKNDVKFLPTEFAVFIYAQITKSNWRKVWLGSLQAVVAVLPRLYFK